jgi:hypothetical protein
MPGQADSHGAGDPLGQAVAVECGQHLGERAGQRRCRQQLAASGENGFAVQLLLFGERDRMAGEPAGDLPNGGALGSTPGTTKAR